MKPQERRDPHTPCCSPAFLPSHTPGIQPYQINNHAVLFLRPRPQPLSGGNGGGATSHAKVRGKPAATGRLSAAARCLVDGRQLMAPGARYCSIRCGAMDMQGQGTVGREGAMLEALRLNGLRWDACGTD
jgi:hypothetical protein